MHFAIRGLIRFVTLLGGAAVAFAQTGVPVITQVMDKETTVLQNARQEPARMTYLQATNSPTQYTATGVPPRVLFNDSGTSGGFLWYESQLTGGSYTVNVTATNAAGASAPMTFRWIIHPSMVDWLRPDKSTYNVGDTITITATYSAPVFVTGAPYLQLWGTKTARYTGGSGTSRLTFTCPVVADDPQIANYYVSDITPGGGAIATADGVSANLHVGGFAYEQPATFSIAGPTSGPDVIQSIYVPRGSYGGPVTLNFAYIHAVTVVGTPVVHLAVNGVARNAVYVGTQSNSLQFQYIPQPGDAGTLSLQSPIDLNGGGITGANGLAVNLNFTPPDTSGIIIDTVAPAAPVITFSDSTSATPSFRGTAEPGMYVDLVQLASTTTIHARAAADGTWSVPWLGTPLPPGAYAFYAVAIDDARNSSAPSAIATVTVAGAPPAVPVASNATITGQVGTPITPVQLEATNSPASFSADPLLGTFGLTLSPSGVVSGTPTQTAAALPMSFTASNTAGTSAAATLTLNLAAAGVVPPPPPPPTPPTTTTPSKSNQSIAFSSPVSAIIVGRPIQLGATSSAGLPITYTVVSGDATINGNTLVPTSTAALTVRASSGGSNTVNPASVDVVFGTPQKAAQAITVATTGGTVPAEKPVTLSGTASSGLPVTYTVVSGPATITGNTLMFTGTGNVVVRASQSGNGTYAAATDSTVTFMANPVDRLVNISSRLHVGPDASHVAIAGFVVTGSTPQPILVRAVGSGLGSFGINDGVAAPQLQLTNTAGTVIATNAGWNNDPQINATGDTVGAFRLATGSKDAALLATLAPGAYTAQVSSASSGSVLIEVYDGASGATVPTKQLINISTRGSIDPGDAMIAGFVVRGAQSKRVLIRAVGPGLSAFGVSGLLSDPLVKVYDASGGVIAQNDNWETGQPVTQRTAPATATEITAAGTAAGAFSLKPGAADAAVVLTLGPGAYTAVVTGASGASGAALVEVYEVNTAP